MNKTIKLSYWLMNNKVDNDQLPDEIVAYYDVFFEGETRPVRKKLSLPVEITKEVAEFFQKHVDAIKAVEGIKS